MLPAVASKVLYISLNGVREPLVRSQVLAYLERLHDHGHRFVFLSFESLPFAAGEEDEIRKRLLDRGIEWKWLRRSRSIGGLSILLDVLKGYVEARRIVKAARIELVHARSFVPAVVAWMLKRTDDVRYINDTRGFWVDEKVYKGSIAASGLAFRIGKAVEGMTLRRSDAIVMLSDRGRRVLSEFRCFRDHLQPPTVVIPTCVDTGRYERRGDVRDTPSSGLVCGYVGSLSAEYLPDKVFEYFSVLRDHFAGATLRLLTRSNPGALWPIVDELDIPRSAVTIEAVAPDDIPARTSEFDVGLCFIRPHFSKSASCPTKVGEYLAAGVPVVANAGIGDLDELLAHREVGVLLRDLTHESIVESMPALQRQLLRPELDEACRHVARDHFSIERGVAAYDELYRRVVGQA